MKELHEEYGQVVYQAEIQKVISRDTMTAKWYELLRRYGNTPEMRGILDDIYDDVTDYPEQWADVYELVTA